MRGKPPLNAFAITFVGRHANNSGPLRCRPPLAPLVGAFPQPGLEISVTNRLTAERKQRQGSLGYGVLWAVCCGEVSRG